MAVQFTGKVAILGGGLMGSGIAQIFASQGSEVAIYDVDWLGCRASENIVANMAQMQRHGLADDVKIRATLDRLCLTGSLEEAAGGAGLVIECVPEDLALKRQLFARLDTLCPVSTILASNTSVISISEIAQDVAHRERVVGTHFWNPPFLIPLVEVIRTEWTSDRVFEDVFHILQQVGKHPVRVRKDVPGFLVNRLQHALWREAIYLVEQGIADAQTVDEGIRYGFGLRLPVLGPLENADMVGTDLTLAIHEYLFPYLNNATTPSPLLRQCVEQKKLGFKSGEGFQRWNESEIKASREGLVEYLLQAIAKH
ncbi:3-hydroxyacyl-CoA dehydrogenase family protein [Sodalis ligni]|uniref:3-hydroxybutyryl-CoA dehydrogenase n=1 Tax=Sodalis ligni TaxID=2697027 RepID=A0A4R1NEV1_9GAMM|nr:3-hydroxyacyl-CoA dehydrogenase NAD-binding domain-containing protein [Sodalis ligni]TCL03186.1 3-hydroxybutyryl-CoA dehydrogenase [Sodalis ligni]